jgi:hypothetical protein
MYDGRCDGHEILRLAGEEMQLVQRQQPLQLGDGIRRIVDPDIDEPVVGAEVAAILPNHQQRRRLHSAFVAATRLSGLERSHQSVRQAASAVLERLGKILHRLI